MSTTMRNDVRFVANPVGRRQVATPPVWRRSLAELEKWATAHAALASVALSLAYLLALSALVAVLATSNLNTPIGVCVMVLFGLMVLALTAVATYTVAPE